MKIALEAEKDNTVIYCRTGISFPSGSEEMLQPSEVIAAKLLPTIRARLSHELLVVHRMKQVRVAHALGITQAAVSHYNTKSRGLDDELIRRFPEIKGFCEDLARSIAGGLPQTEQVARIDEFTDGLMHTARFCDYHKKITDIDPNCAICFPSPPRP